jgi:uncharacterized protein (TIGR01244 family)
MPIEYRRLTPDYCVSPQIAPQDFAAIKAAGYVMVINNRPNGEVGSDLHSDTLAAAAKAAGLAYVANPITPGQFSHEMVAAQAAAIKAANGPVFAYCASGNRSTLAWELVKAPEVALNTLLEISSSHGYDHAQFAPLIAAFAQR